VLNVGGTTSLYSINLVAQTIALVIASKAEAAKFRINAPSGALAAVTAPDFENDDQPIIVTVTDLNESRFDCDANADGFVSNG